jgi:hypothetical protein
MKKIIAKFIWNASEALHIPLGRFAPTIFGWMIGANSWKKVEEPGPPSHPNCRCMPLAPAIFAQMQEDKFGKSASCWVCHEPILETGTGVNLKGWKCEGCDTAYAEYVNGCPRCGSKVEKIDNWHPVHIGCFHDLGGDVNAAQEYTGEKRV